MSLYQDLDLNFQENPLTGDVSISYDVDSVNKNLKYLILTQNYEVPAHPEFGCQVHGMLFELLTPVTINIMKRTILDTIGKYEPRVSVNTVNIFQSPTDSNGIRITIQYTLISTSQEVTFSTILTRIR
jgi:phage baseplate assembly protein W